MDILVNKTSHAINVDGVLLIPGVPQEVGDAKSLASLYPRFADYLESGDVVIRQKKSKAVKPAPATVEPVEVAAETPAEKRRNIRRKKEEE